MAELEPRISHPAEVHLATVAKDSCPNLSDPRGLLGSDLALSPFNQDLLPILM
jgi:hypothetical protein